MGNAFNDRHRPIEKNSEKYALSSQRNEFACVPIDDKVVNLLQNARNDKKQSDNDVLQNTVLFSIRICPTLTLLFRSRVSLSRNDFADLPIERADHSTATKPADVRLRKLYHIPFRFSTPTPFISLYAPYSSFFCRTYLSDIYSKPKKTIVRDFRSISSLVQERKKTPKTVRSCA